MLVELPGEEAGSEASEKGDDEHPASTWRQRTE